MGYPLILFGSDVVVHTLLLLVVVHLPNVYLGQLLLRLHFRRALLRFQVLLEVRINKRIRVHVFYDIAHVLIGATHVLVAWAGDVGGDISFRKARVDHINRFGRLTLLAG